ncbi:unnamed protein product [Menidia menidia]|uniref:(Atlantic silverside) hypothetical protein n=1 Tax=Menidia menidia TaxID=238744 RepID=A0A8S4BGW0_9TELE|nr:unnamed protein product [Menidia menidia]
MRCERARDLMRKDRQEAGEREKQVCLVFFKVVIWASTRQRTCLGGATSQKGCIDMREGVCVSVLETNRVPQETKDGTLQGSSKTSSSAGMLAQLISQMQTNADQVEKDILRSEQLLAVDAENDKKEQPFVHQDEIKKKLSEAEGLLETLFLDVGKAKNLKHPQANEIENDVIHLHERWLKDCVFYRDIYEQIDDVSLMPRIDWGPVLNQKQKEVNIEEYGPSMADLEKQIAAHNILHKEIEAYNSQLCVSSAGSKDNSKWRRHYLNSLYEYMQGCNKELSFLREEQDKIKKQDWSDRMVDPPDVRRQYENFKNNSLLSHETEVNKLQDEGDRLVEMKHPASSTIEYQMDTEQLSETLTKLNNNLDPKAISKKSNSETLLQLEADERTVDNCEQLLADLRRRSTSIAPLKMRRSAPTRSTTIESLCDWETERASLSRGEKFTLKSNSDVENWDIMFADGTAKTFPGVCFQIPPPDPDAIDKVDFLGGELADIKKKRAALAASLKNHKSDINRVQKQGSPVSSSPPDPKVAALAQQLDKLDSDLTNTEEKMLSRLRTPLSRTDPIEDLAKRMNEQQSQRKSVAAAQDDMKKLSQDLEATEQLCSSLQQGYQEYCPDIQRQRKDVKQLQTRYTNIANQLKERDHILQDTSTKNQEFQSTCKSLNSFLDNLPTNQINSSDDLSQVSSKQNSQERVVDDLKRKEDDMDRVAVLSQDLQNLLNEYGTNVDKYNSTLEDSGASVPKKSTMPTLSDAVQKTEKDLVNRYAEATAENTQRQKQMGLAKSLILQNEEKVQMVAQQQVQVESQQRSASEVDGLMKELDEERERRAHSETNLKTFKDRMMSLKSRRGVERVEEKEVLQYYRDPKLENDLAELSKTLHDETLRHIPAKAEIETINKKIIVLEDTLKTTPPKLLTREVTEFESDPQLDVEAAKMRDEIGRMRDEIRVKDGEQIQMKTEVTILQQKQPPIKNRVVEKEVIQVKQDPEMLRAMQTFETDISDEGNKSKILNDEIFQTRSQINALERLIPNIPPKIVTKEVKTIEQDPELITASKSIQTNLEQERTENNSLSQELMQLHSRYREVQDWKPRVEVKEIVNEIYRIDPNTEVEIMRIRKDIQDTNRHRADLDNEITQVTTDLNILRSEKPKVELKEVLQEVVKEERSPENEREIQRLNDQVNYLHTQYNSLEDKVRLLRKERDELKAEKSKVETKLVTREVIKYEPDPLFEKEADRLRRDVREEAQLRRNIEEMVFDLQNKYILLERQKPEEKIVMQEVVRLQKDPRQLMDHEKLGRKLDEEVKSRRQVELELQQLRSKVEDKERTARECDEHQKRIQAESKLREIRLRITQLENAPPPVEESIVVEEVLKVERDPRLERMTNSLRSDMDKETSDMLRLQRDIRNIKAKVEILQKEKSCEKTVYKEVVRVEKDQAVEAERDRLREQVSENKFARQDLEDQIRRLNDKINLLTNTKSNSSREETMLTVQRDALMREKDDLTRELRTLDGKRHDISLSFQQQTRLMSERTQMSRQRSIKMESDMQKLERNILDEKDKIHQRDSTIRELVLNLQKEEQAETRTKETNVSTRISILDPDTGKDMSPYDAYLQGLIDRQQYIHLQELECDWEEITSVGPDGETSVLQDRKSGKQYPIKDALKEGRLTEYDLQQYKKGKIPISEFALLVAGDTKTQPQLNSIIPKSTTTVNSGLDPSATYPIAGIMDMHTDTSFTIRSATLRRLIDSTTAQRLLEAQAATGGIVDPTNNKRYTVHQATNRGLVDDSQLQRLLNAQKAFTGIEDPMTRECLSVGEAVQKGWMPKDSAIRYMEAQHLTGGLVIPNTDRRLSIIDAFSSKMIDSTTMRELQSETTYIKDIVDPITKEKINYKQALDR